MNMLVLSLIGIATVDSLNPTTIAFLIYFLSTPKPVIRSVTFVFGVFAAYLTGGLLFIFGISQLITNFVNNFIVSAGWFIYVIQFIIGVVLIVIGLKINQFSNNQPTKKRPKVLKPFNTFLLGFAATFWDIPTALPYIAAIEQIVKANLNFSEIIVLLIIYNFIFVFPAIILIVVYIMFTDKAADIMIKITQQITKWFPKLNQVFLIAFGLWLVVDCIFYSLKQLLQ